MRVGILTQWFEPEPGGGALPGVLGRELIKRGHSVQVLTGFPNYPTGKIAPGYRIRRRVDENIDGMDVRRVALYPYHGHSPVGRIANYGSFGASAVVSGMSALSGVDALWVYNSPITVSWPMWAARLLRRIPSALHIMDLWPDSIMLSGLIEQGRPFAATKKAIDSWCGVMYRSASSIAYTSPSVGRVLLERGVCGSKLSYVPVWADEKVHYPSSKDLRSQLGIDESAIVLLYAGALGDAQGLSALIDACAKVQDQRFVCLIAGSGIAEGALRFQAERQKVECVRFLGRIPPDQMTPLMATSDVSYIGLRPGGLANMTIPSKTQAALASGRALLVSAAGDLADLVQKSGAGWVVAPGDPVALARAIARICEVGRPSLASKGETAAAYYQQNLSLSRGVTSVEVLLTSAAQQSQRRSRI